MLLLGLMAGLGCTPKDKIVESSYRVTMPVLVAPPLEHACRIGDLGEVSCTCLATMDYQKIVRKMKAACLALGGTDVECQTEAP